MFRFAVQPESCGQQQPVIYADTRIVAFYTWRFEFCFELGAGELYCTLSALFLSSCHFLFLAEVSPYTTKNGDVNRAQQIDLVGS